MVQLLPAPCGYLSLGLVFPEDLQQGVVSCERDRRTARLGAARRASRRGPAWVSRSPTSARTAYAAVEFEMDDDVAQTLRLPKEAVERQNSLRRPPKGRRGEPGGDHGGN